MIYIRRKRDHEERSMHMDNAVGLSAAIQEAVLRAQYTHTAYEVFDSHGIVLHVVYPLKDQDEGWGYWASKINQYSLWAYSAGVASGAAALLIAYLIVHIIFG